MARRQREVSVLARKEKGNLQEVILKEKQEGKERRRAEKENSRDRKRV